MTTSEAQVAGESNTFGLIVCESRQARVWTKAELARRAEMTQSEVNRLESGKRMCLAKAFSEAPRGDEPASYEGWLAVLVDVGETCRQDLRAAQRSSGD